MSFREGRVSGHLQGQRILLLRPVADAHPEQHGRDHPLFPHTPTERPDAPHRQVSRLRQPLAEERSGVAGHQPGLGGVRGSSGARQWQVQRQCLA